MGFSIIAAFFVWSDGGQIAELSWKIDQSQKRLEAKDEKIINLLEENKRLNKEIGDWMTGGDSACFIFPMIDEISDRQTLQLFHQGKNPIFDVVISVEDRSADIPIKQLYEEIIESHNKDVSQGRKKQRDLSLEMDKLLDSRIKHFNIGTLTPNTMIPLSRIKLPLRETQEFFIRISTRNGYFTQNIKQQKINGRWQSSWKLIKHEGGGELQESKTVIGPQFEYKE